MKKCGKIQKFTFEESFAEEARIEAGQLRRK